MRRLVLPALIVACLLAPACAAQAASEKGLPVPVAGAGALQPGPGSLCSLAPPAW